MKYKLAKKLKDVGFPQNLGITTSFQEQGLAPDPIDGRIGLYTPTLSELIEACGEDFFQLTKGSDIWYAEGDIVGTDKVTGSTPEEAVANLYILLKETDNK